MDIKARNRNFIFGMVLVVIAFTLLMAIVANMRASHDKTTAPLATSTGIVQISPVPSGTSENFPPYLLLKIGGLARLTDNGGSDVMKISIYKSLSDVQAYCIGDTGATFNEPAKSLVKILGFQRIASEPGSSGICNPVLHVGAPDGSWSGWVPQVVVEPNLPVGVKLVVEKGTASNQIDIYETPDGNHGSFKVSDGTVLKYLGFDDTPGETDYHIQIMSGASSGKTGWVDTLLIRSENGDSIALYESPETAKQENVPGGSGAYASLEASPTPTPGEATIAERETNRLSDYIANYNKSLSLELYSSASVDDTSATFVVDADVWNAMSGQDQRLVFNNAVHAWGELFQINHPDRSSVELPIHFQDLSGQTVKQDVIMIGSQD